MTALFAVSALLCTGWLQGAEAAPTRSNFDHLTTGFELVGQHRDLQCETCHANAVFKGTPKECSSCHGIGTTVRATAKPVSHIVSTDRCGACHTPIAWNPAVSFDHLEVRGSCSTCHNGVQAVGKGPSHIETTLECDACHSTVGWAGAVFNHAGVTGNCADCHNGVRATGKPAAHVPVGAAPCEACHSTTNFTTFRMDNVDAHMDHSVVSGTSCATCHEKGLTWIGSPPTVVRPATKANGQVHAQSGDCNTCHFNTTSFKGATDLPSNHIPLPTADNGDCTLCHSNSADYSVYSMNHVNISGNCQQCHASGSAFANMAPPTLKVPSSNHIPTTRSCDNCHSTTNFAAGAFNTATMNHAGISSGCATCHAVGKSFTNLAPPALKEPPSNHIPFGSANCESCHSASVFTSFQMTNTGTSMNHSVVTAIACSTCHEKGTSFVGTPATVVRPALKANGQKHVATGECNTCHLNTTSFKGASDLPTNHIPLPAADNNDCSICHSNGNDYSVYLMSHVNISSNCTQCHGSGKSFANMAPPTLVVPAGNHLPTTQSCETCHSAANFATGAFNNATMNHAGITSGCATCHAAGKTFANMAAPTLVQPAGNHLPTTQSCETCHSASNFVTGAFNNATMSHTGITSGCASCHATGKSFANMAPPTLKQPPNNHIPFAGANCESCHSASVFTSFQMANNGADMNHTVVTSLACSTCHEKGLSWVGTPSTVLRPPLKANGQVHVTSGECSTCHFNTTSFKGASDLPSGHLPIPAADNANCSLCHSNPSDYSVYSMNHVNITSNCAQCHGSGLSFTNIAAPALKQPSSTHIPTTQSCETCHSASNFATGAFNSATMNHAGITSGCATCHANGKTFANMAPPTLVVAASNHIPTTQSCETCHSASNFAAGAFNSATMNHAGITSGCASCHAAGKTFANMAPPTLKQPPNNHVPFAGANCESCHSPSVFTNFVMTNNSTSMNHTVVTSLVCSTCHEKGLSWVGTPATVLRPALKANGQPHVTSGECSTCHFNTTSFKGATDLPNGHIPLPTADNGNCSLCHSNASDYSVYSMNHVNIASNCAQCHGSGLSFTNIAAPALKQPSSTHIPTTQACETCHAASNFATGAFNSATMNHAGITSGCATCHATGKSFANMAPPTLKVPPSNHVPFASANCESCHSPSVFTNFIMTNNSTSMNHTVVTSLVCSTCHEAGKTWAGSPATVVRPALKANGQPHVAAGECSACHFNTTSFKGAQDYPTNHIPVPAADNNNCTLCHSNASDYSVYSMNHVNISSNCAQCHGSGLSFANIAPPALKEPSANHIPTTQSCETCHSASNFASGAFNTATMNHAGITSGCATCHANGKTFTNLAPPTLVVAASNHIPTTQSCETCHSASNFATGAFNTATMNHAGITSGCAACHAAGSTFANMAPPTLKVPPTNHVPIATAACESCHSKSVFTSFLMTNNATDMNHTVVTAQVCSTCHEAGKTWVGTPATVVRPALKANGQPHVTGGECSTCHFNTTSFKGATDLPGNHIPLPTADNGNCALCHTNTNDYSVYTMNHVNITSNCAQCHAYGLSFANIAAPTLKQPTAGAAGHIPVVAPNGTGTVACEACHKPNVFSTFSGTVMVHAAVRGMTCMSCHELGMKWQTNKGVQLWVRDSANHHKGQDCGGSGCHSTRDKRALRPRPTAVKTVTGTATTQTTAPAPATTPSKSGVTVPANVLTGIRGGLAIGAMNHANVAGTPCVSCHNAARGMGKDASHPTTSDNCASCHTVTVWLPVSRVDHSQVKGVCASCHNGTVARAKPLRHVPSSNNCETCHTTNAWMPARFDHAAAPANACKTCHDGAHAPGLPVNHIPTTASCDACHGTLAWTPVKVDHRTLTQGCVSCHNGAAATGVTPTHMNTRRDCSTCHVYPNWTPIVFAHVSAAYPGNHRNALTCSNCHATNAETVPYSFPADAGSCGGCHHQDFKASAHPKVAGGASYTASELKNCSGACHVYGDATLRGVAHLQPGPHHRVSDAAFKH